MSIRMQEVLGKRRWRQNFFCLRPGTWITISMWLYCHLVARTISLLIKMDNFQVRGNFISERFRCKNKNEFHTRWLKRPNKSRYLPSMCSLAKASWFSLVKTSAVGTKSLQNPGQEWMKISFMCLRIKILFFLTALKQPLFYKVSFRFKSFFPLSCWKRKQQKTHSLDHVSSTSSLPSTASLLGMKPSNLWSIQDANCWKVCLLTLTSLLQAAMVPDCVCRLRSF